MEVVKCRLCKDEIEYSQCCRVYIKTNEPRTSQRTSKRAHLGRYKLISIAPSTEHISFARRLKRIQKGKQQKENTTLNNNEESAVIDTSFHKTEESSEQTESSVSSKEANSVKEKSDTSVEDSQSAERSSVEVKENEASSSETPLKRKRGRPRKTPIKPIETEQPVEKRETRQNMSRPQFQSSFEEYIKPKISKTAAKIKKTKSTDSNSDLELNRKGTSISYRPMKNPKNENNRTPPQEFETYYWLDLPKLKTHELKKLGYQFENLVTEVKHMKLPSSEWKIKIMVHKQEMVSVSFSNKQTPEKVVSVNAKNSVCDISIDSKKLCLVGSPIYIYTIKDLEVLLDIMNDIEPESPLIQYI